LEYEFKQLKLKVSKTSEDGQNKLKENFPYHSIFDQITGYRDSIVPPLLPNQMTTAPALRMRITATPQRKNESLLLHLCGRGFGKMAAFHGTCGEFLSF